MTVSGDAALFKKRESFLLRRCAMKARRFLADYYFAATRRAAAAERIDGFSRYSHGEINDD